MYAGRFVLCIICLLAKKVEAFARKNLYLLSSLKRELMKAAEVLRSVNDFEELGGLDGDNQLPISSVTVNICLIFGLFFLFVSYLFGEKKATMRQFFSSVKVFAKYLSDKQAR